MLASASLQWPGLTAEPCAFQVKSAFTKNPYMPFSGAHLFSHFFEGISVYSNTLLSENWVIKKYSAEPQKRKVFTPFLYVTVWRTWLFSSEMSYPISPIMHPDHMSSHLHSPDKKKKLKVTSQVLWVQNNTILIIKSTLYSIPFHISRQVEKNNLLIYCTP